MAELSYSLLPNGLYKKISLLKNLIEKKDNRGFFYLIQFGSFQNEELINLLEKESVPFWMQFKLESKKIDFPVKVQREGDLSYGDFQAHLIVECRLRVL